MTQEVRSTLPRLETIFGVPACINIDELSADVAFLGIPYEQGQSLMRPTGQKWGPKAVRADIKGYNYQGYPGSIASAGEEGGVGWFDMDDAEWKLRGVTMADCGDVNILAAEGANVDRMTNCDRMTEVVRKILDRGAFPVLIGGEHTLTGPVVRAFDRYDPLDIVHFDAHLDFYDSAGGVKITNADCMIRCSEFPFVHHISSIGINPRMRWTPQTKEGYDAAVEYGVNIITVKKFRQMGVSQVVESIPQAKNIYVTIDIDCMDCLVVPAFSGQEVDGLSYSDIVQTLVGIPNRGKVVGFDVNGLIPALDSTGVTTRVVTNLILDLLTAIFPSKR